jgi:hypothetical protein
MKITRLDLRYTANKKWGYNYSVTFRGREWRKYFAFSSLAKNMLGLSTDIGRTFIWREQADILRTGPWAYKYVRSSEDTYVYFRTEEAMNQVIMMFALTNSD